MRMRMRRGRGGGVRRGGHRGCHHHLLVRTLMGVGSCGGATWGSGVIVVRLLRRVILALVLAQLQGGGTADGMVMVVVMVVGGDRVVRIIRC